jgi:hypothetical protein
MSFPVGGVGAVYGRVRLLLDVHARVQQNVDFLLQCKTDPLNVLTLFQIGMTQLARQMREAWYFR